MNSRRRRLPAVVVASGVVMAAVACSSASSSSGTSTGASAAPSTAAASVGSLSIGLPGASTVPAALILAQQLGYFKKFGVNVTLVNSGSVEITEVAGGQLDMVMFGTDSSFSAAKSGRQTSIVYGMMGNTTTAVLVPGNSKLVKKSTTDATIMQLAGERVAVEGVGTETYGDAEAINGYITSHGGKPMTLVSYISAGAIADALDTGTIDAGIGAADYVASEIQSGKVRMIVAEDDPTIQAITGGATGAGTGASLYGLTSNLQNKKKAVVAAISAIRAAWAYMRSEPTATIAAELHENSLLSSVSTADLAAQLAYDKPFWDPSNGVISASEWTATLSAFKLWGLGVDLSSSTFSYNNMVDMSYYDA